MYVDINNPVSEIMSDHVIAIGADCNIDEAQEILNSNKLRTAPVVDVNGKCFGVLGAADILHAYEAKENLKAIRAWEICTPIVLSVDPSSPVREAINLMIKNGVHHIIVIEKTKIKGIISALDILRIHTSSG